MLLRVVPEADLGVGHPADAAAVLCGFLHHDLVEFGVRGGQAHEPP